MTKAILSLVFIGISVIAFVMYIRPTYDETQSFKSRDARFEVALKKLKEIEIRKRELISRVVLFTPENVARLEKIIPNHVDNVRLVLDLEGMGSAYGIKVKNVVAETDSKAQIKNAEDGVLISGDAGHPFQSKTLQFEVIASYDDFISFLRDLETSLRIVEIESLSVKPYGTRVASQNQSEIKSEELYSFALTLRTFWLR